jgi:hypothetical protein
MVPDMTNKVDITPETKVGPLLDAYPQLEDMLMSMSPSFAKLKNPVLRRTVGKVATLRQVAKVGNIPVGKLVNDLRHAVGQGSIDIGNDGSITSAPRPEWMNINGVTDAFDARPMIDAGEQPLGHVFAGLNKLESGQIYKLTTPFIPSPIIEMAAKKGFKSWMMHEGPDLFQTYFTKE